MSHPETRNPAGVGRGSRRDTRTTIDDDMGRIGGKTGTVNHPVDPRREAALADLRRARRHAMAYIEDVDAIGHCLRHGCITTQQALDHMRDMGVPVLSDWRPGDTIGEAA